MKAPRATWLPWQRVFVGVWAVVLGLNLAVLAERVFSLVTSYRLFITEGGEGAHIYAIWRLLHGLPLYQSPDHPPFSLTYYNFLFYRLYSWVLALLQVDGEALLAVGRVVTFAIAVAGSLVYVSVARQLLPPSARTRQAMWFLALYAPVLWIGTNFTSWWALSIRPDIGAAFCSLLGFWLVSKHPDGRSLTLLGASGLFWLAWAFKQPAVLTFGATLVYFAIIQRHWRATICLVTPFLGLVLLTVVLGGAPYRYNTLLVPQAAGFLWLQIAQISARVALQNTFVWVPAVSLAAVLLHRRLRHNAPAVIGADNDRTVTLVATASIVSLAGGLLLLGHEASNKNQLMEANLICGLASARWLLSSWAEPAGKGTRATLAAMILSLPMAVFPAAQLAWPNRFGITRLADRSRYEAKAKLAAYIDTLPKPIFILDDVLAQPWHSTDGRSPAVVIDVFSVDVAIRHGLLTPTWPTTLIRKAGFAIAIVPQESVYHHAAMANGYRCEALTQCPQCPPGFVECRQAMVPKHP